MANPTMTLIASNTVGSGGVSSVTFSSIPATYTDLVAKVSARQSNANIYGAINMQLNGTDGAMIFLQGDGASASSTNNSGVFQPISAGASATANTFGNVEVYIPNYISSNNKSVSSDSVGENNATTAYSRLVAGIYTVTSAITSVTFTSNSGSFNQYSTFYLYGISSS